MMKTSELQGSSSRQSLPHRPVVLKLMGCHRYQRHLLVSVLLLTMIDTYQTCVAPPPGPPCNRWAKPILIPASLPARGSNKHLIRFLVVVAVLHLSVSVATLIFVFYQNQMVRHPSSEKRGDFYPSDQMVAFSKTSANLVVQKQSDTPLKKLSGILQWDPRHSVLQNIHLRNKSWLTILHPGEYYVYSRVTFSKGDTVRPLASRVQLRESVGKEETVVMQSFCSLGGSSSSIPHPCTATQGQLVTLEKGNQLSLWVQDVSLVDYDETSTTFGAYKV